MNDFLTLIGDLFDKRLKSWPSAYKVIVALMFLLVIGLFIRDLAS